MGSALPLADVVSSFSFTAPSAGTASFIADSSGHMKGSLSPVLISEKLGKSGRLGISGRLSHPARTKTQAITATERLHAADLNTAVSLPNLNIFNSMIANPIYRSSACRSETKF